MKNHLYGNYIYYCLFQYGELINSAIREQSKIEMKELRMFIIRMVMVCRVCHIILRGTLTSKTSH